METDGAEILVSFLSSEFQYRVRDAKILNQSEIHKEVKFHASFEENICRKEEAETFFSYIASKNGTDMKAPTKEKVWMGFSSNRFNCTRIIRDQRSAKDDNQEKRSGQGRLKGAERQQGNGTSGA